MRVSDEGVRAARGVINLEIKRCSLATVQNLYRYGWAGFTADEINGHLGAVADLAERFKDIFCRQLCEERDGRPAVMSYAIDALDALRTGAGRWDGGAFIVDLPGPGLNRYCLWMPGDPDIQRGYDMQLLLRVGEWIPSPEKAAEYYRFKIIEEIAYGNSCSSVC